MRFLWRWIKRGVALLLILVLGLLSPVAYVETMCRSPVLANDYTSILPPADRRPEARTLLTYPEWHIVHAYDDYAEVIRTGDPADFGYLSSIGGFWSSLCSLSGAAGAHGGVDWPTKQMVYTIGVSFTAELLLKAAYEETLGRLATLIRGDTRSPLDDLSATQAADYATFLQQVPWYRWDFRSDAAALQAARTDTFRDRERALALGLEYRAKAGYAGVIAAAVAGMEPDALTMRSIVTGLTPEVLASIKGVTVIAERPEGIEIETPRYRAFTDLARVLAANGAAFVEIAGNDDILFTAISDTSFLQGALHSFPRQGNPGYRHLVMVKVNTLAQSLRSGIEIEQIHDY
jgi:hypothetical protein